VTTWATIISPQAWASAAVRQRARQLARPAGPIGMVAGAAIGAAAGGAAGKGVASVVNPQAEDAYWRTAYLDAPYFSAGRTYDDYGPAYRLGYTSRGRYDGAFDDYESTLRASGTRIAGSSRLTWNEAKAATRAAWDRITVEAPSGGGTFERS
jgi:hypothetical protein